MPKASFKSLRPRVPTYVGHQIRSPSMEYAEPDVPLVAYEDRGLRIVLRSHVLSWPV